MAELTQEQIRKAARRALENGDTAAAQELIEYGMSLDGGKKAGPETVATTEDGGRVYRMADGKLGFTSPNFATTDPERVAQIMQGATPVELLQGDVDKQRIAEHPIAARANEVVRGTPFIGSYADDAVGLVSPQAGENMRRTSGAMERQKPGQTAALNVAGGIAGAIPMALAAAPSVMGALPASRVGQAIYGLLGGSAAGATEGTIYGAGEGEGADERLDNAGRGAKLGGLLGAFTGAAAPLVGSAVRSAVGKLKGSDVGAIAQKFGISKEAATVVRQHLDADQLDEAVNTLRSAGADAMLGEATPGSRALLDATAARGGPAANVVNRAVDGRVSAAHGQFTQASDDVLGKPVQGLLTAADEVAERSAPARSAAYSEAYSTPIDYASSAGRAVEDVIGRTPPKVVMDAIADANEDMLARNMPRNQQIMAQLGEDGAVKFVEMPNVQQMDALKKALQRVARQNVDTFGRLDGKGQRYDMLAGQLRDSVGQAARTPDGRTPYLDAVKIGGDKLREEEALTLGRDLLRQNTTRDDVLRKMTGASADEKAAAKAGLRLAIDEKMANVRRIVSDPNIEARQVAAAIGEVSSDAARTKIKAVLGPQEANRLLDEVDRLTQGFNLRASVSENSRTARRLAVNSSIDDVTDRSFFQTAQAGEPIESTKRVVQLLTGETKEALAFRRDGVAKEIAEFLTNQRGRSAEAALEYVNKAVAGQRLTDAQARFVADQLAVTGYLSAGEPGREAIAPYVPGVPAVRQ